MKIGFFCNEYPPRPHGGIGTFVHSLAQALQQDGHEITIVQLGDAAGNELLDGVNVVTLIESKTRYVAWWLNRLRLWRWLNAEALASRIEIFEIPEYQGCLPFPFLSCPVVVRLHLSESLIRSIMGEGYSKAYFLEKSTLFWHRNWVGVSGYILEKTSQFFSLKPSHGLVIHNPAPLIDQNSLPDINCRPDKYVVFVGSVSVRKGALLLAEAMREVFTTRSDVHLVYVGPETEYLGAPISETIRRIVGNYDDRIVITGQVTHEEALAWLRDAYVLAFVSKIESFGLVATEAMSLGVPVICAASGPGPELLVDGVSGILINPDSSQELIQALIFILNNPISAVSIGEAGQCKVINDFTMSACIKKTLDYYQNTLDGKSGNK